MSADGHRQTIGLCMIVRDEEEVIGRCLASVRPLISTWTICDTGSKDGTAAAIEEALAGIPGQLHHRAWRDFGTNRTELMRLAEGSADYLLLLDADMTIEQRAELPHLTADAYLVEHAGPLRYWIPRLVRGDRRWHFVGSTHEYLAADGSYAQEWLPALVVHHHGDGSSRPGKLQRDAGLLEQEIERDPANARAVFYLAQTRRDLGQPEEALALYRRRVEMGGWDEEAFYAALQAGLLSAELETPVAAARSLIEAHRMRPSRGEPLHALARLCREQRWYRSAYRFARRGAELPMPNDLLFVDREVHEWKLPLELAYAAWALGEIDEATEAFDRALESDSIPADRRAMIRRDRRRCRGSAKPGARGDPDGGIEILADLVTQLDFGEIRIEVRPEWPIFNPSIAADGNGFKLLVRSASYRLGRHGPYESVAPDGKIHTINYLADLDHSLAVRDVTPITSACGWVDKPGAAIQGYEDLRLARSGGQWLGIGTVFDDALPGWWQIVVAKLDGAVIGSAVRAQSPDSGRPERNWVPVPGESGLKLVYSYGPTVVLGCDPETGATETISRRDAPAATSAFRGGSQGIAVAGGTLLCVHEVLLIGGARRYVHRFVLLDRSHRLTAYSPRFSFTGEPIEFCAGIARRANDLVLSFGVGDRIAALALCSESQVLGLLEPCAPS